DVAAALRGLLYERLGHDGVVREERLHVGQVQLALDQVAGEEADVEEHAGARTAGERVDQDDLQAARVDADGPLQLADPPLAPLREGGVGDDLTDAGLDRLGDGREVVEEGEAAEQAVLAGAADDAVGAEALQLGGQPAEEVRVVVLAAAEVVFELARLDGAVD